MVLLLALLAQSSFGIKEFHAAGATLRVEVRSSVLTYTLTNRAPRPVTEFRVAYGEGYDFQAPPGWESSAENHVFRAWAPRPGLALGPGQSGRFSFRVTSAGAVLGTVRTCIQDVDGATIEFPAVWGAAPEPASHVLAIAAVLAALMLLHALVMVRGPRGAAPTPGPPDPAGRGSAGPPASEAPR